MSKPEYTINLSETKKAEIQPDMIGLFFEDINYAADGGLYAEMIENRAFEFADCRGHKGDYYTIFDGLYGWSAAGEESKAELLIVSGSPLSQENPHYLRFTAKEAGAGFKNKAYDGISLKKGMNYNVSFYARNTGRVDSVKVLVRKNGIIYAEKETALVKEEPNSLQSWRKYELVLSASYDVRNAEFTVVLNEAGTVEFDFISMIPEDAVAGIFRKDLFDKLAALHPGFIRFPGGCIIEGNTLDNRYRFKDTLKPLTDRKSNWNRWAVHGNDVKLENGEFNDRSIYSHYNQTYGIGYYEFFLLCELLKAKPLPVLNVGLACQYQSYELVEIEDPEFQEFLQDAVDLISFANDPVDTVWGAVRAELGHPEPFNLEMVGIGNEQWETDKTRFFARYKLFEKKIHDIYPDIRLIGSAGPDITSEKYENAWRFIRESAQENESFVYAVDEHYYVKPEWFYEHVDFYDEYPRNVKVFSGEYAAHPEGSGQYNNYKANTLGGALAEAAFLTGVERNADVVVLASYAPLFARCNYTQWSPDMIWFDDTDSYGTPSYYVQKLYSDYRGTAVLDTMGQERKLWKSGIYYNTVYDASKDLIYLKIVNANEEEVSIEVKTAEGSGMTAEKWVVLGGDDKAVYNSIDDSQHIVIREKNVMSDKYVLERNSLNVIIFGR